MKFVRRKEILLLKEETRNAKFGVLVSLGANKSISTDHFFSSSLANIPERGMKVETNEVLEPVTEGTNLSKEIQVKGPLRRNRTLSN